MPDITTAELAAALIACLEGSKLHAYPDSGGVLTIGIGHTRGVTEGMIITPDQQAAYFEEDSAPLIEMVKDVPILEAGALASFGFNCGQSALARVMGGHDLITNPVHTTDRHGTVLSGLQNRRNLEQLLVILSQQLMARGA